MEILKTIYTTINVICKTIILRQSVSFPKHLAIQLLSNSNSHLRLSAKSRNLVNREKNELSNERRNI